MGGQIINKKEDKENDNLFLVKGVIDGDTIKLANKKRVRLLGVNLSEKGEYFYKEAEDGLRDLIKYWLKLAQKIGLQKLRIDRSFCNL